MQFHAQHKQNGEVVINKYVRHSFVYFSCANVGEPGIHPTTTWSLSASPQHLLNYSLNMLKYGIWGFIFLRLFLAKNLALLVHLHHFHIVLRFHPQVFTVNGAPMSISFSSHIIFVPLYLWCSWFPCVLHLCFVLLPRALFVITSYGL